MLIKLRDATSFRLGKLERMEANERDPLKRIEIQQALGRLRADTTTEKACEFLNNYFQDSPDWALLHDVRLEIDRRQAIANHILIDRGLRFYWLDTRYIDCGLTIHSSGACTAHRAGRDKIESTPIASPLNKLQKDLRTFTAAVRQTQNNPGWSSFIKPPIIKGFILTSSSIKNSVPRDSTIDTSPLINRDSLFPLIWKSREGENGLWSRDGSESNLVGIAANLMEQHRPVVKPGLLVEEIDVDRRATHLSDTAHCYYCGGGVAEDERDYSFRNMDVYGGRVVCFKCQNQSDASRKSMRVEYQR
ncbi:MAG: hypothetical protein KTR33_04955 [Gammaproteobacteria bacterium]|nr:hypothetical protein [Gammaproteobacteria bacterium]